MARPTPEFYEYNGWPREKTGLAGHFEAERKVKCAWADRHAVLEHLSWQGGEPYPYLRYDSSDDKWKDTGARAIGASAVPFGGAPADYDQVWPAEAFPADAWKGGPPIGLGTYEHALVTVQYSTQYPRLFKGSLVTEEIRPAGELTSIYATNLRWGSKTGDPVQPAEAPPVQHRYLEVILTYHAVRAIPVEAVAFLGCTNNASVISPVSGMVFLAERLLYTCPDIERTLQIGGKDTYRLTYRFLGRHASWNQFWRSTAAGAADNDVGAFTSIYDIDGNRYRPYPLVKLSDLVPDCVIDFS